MSRTKHRRRGESPHRQTAPVRLTKQRGEWYHPLHPLHDEQRGEWYHPLHDEQRGEWYHPLHDEPAADGNQWGGTISHVGGDSRRRNQRQQRELKRQGRRSVRRALNREIPS